MAASSLSPSIKQASCMTHYYYMHFPTFRVLCMPQLSVALYGSKGLLFIFLWGFIGRKFIKKLFSPLTLTRRLDRISDSLKNTLPLWCNSHHCLFLLIRGVCCHEEESVHLVRSADFSKVFQDRHTCPGIGKKGNFSGALQWLLKLGL